MVAIVPDEDTWAGFDVTTLTTGPFNFGFQYFEKADLEVSVDGVVLALSAWNLTTGSAVEAAGYDGGSFTLNTGVSNARVVIARKTKVERDANLSASQLNFANINALLSRYAYSLQEFKRDIARALLAAYGDTSDSFDFDGDDLAAVSAIAAEISTLAGIDAEVLIAAGLADEIQIVADNIDDILNAADFVAESVKTTALYASAQALTGLTNGQFVYIGGRGLVNDGAGGYFRYQTGDYTAQVTADPQKGRYLPLSSDPTGATGVLVRQTKGPALFDAKEFNAQGDNSTNDATSLNATLSAVPTAGSVPGGIVTIPNGRYLSDTALTVPDYTTLKGQGQTTTRLNFSSLSSGSAILATGQDYYNSFTDFLVENAPEYALEMLDGSNSLAMNLAILGKTTGTTSGGIKAGINSYMNAFINIRATDVREYGWYNVGFTTSQLLLNYFVLGSDKSGFRWNHTVYSCAINTGSDDALEYGHEITNANALTLISPGVERSAKAAFKFQAGASLDPVTVTNVKDVKDVVIMGAFANDCGGSGEPTAIEAVATDNRVIRALLLGFHDDNAAGGDSVDIDGAYVHFLAIGGQFPGGVTAANGATFGHMKYDENGLTFEINETRRMRIDEGTTSFNNTLNNAYGFIFSCTTDSIGEIGIWLRPGDTNASARDWGIGLGRHERGDYAITQGASQGANPVSGTTRLHIRADGKVGIGTTAASEMLHVSGNARVSGHYKVGANQVVGAQGAAIADVPTAGSATAAGNATAINSILARLRAHGLIAT